MDNRFESLFIWKFPGILSDKRIKINWCTSPMILIVIYRIVLKTSFRVYLKKKLKLDFKAPRTWSFMLTKLVLILWFLFYQSWKIKLTNQDSIKVSKVLKPTNKSTGVYWNFLYWCSPMSPLPPSPEYSRFVCGKKMRQCWS